MPSQRSKSYLGTFVNNQEGFTAYRMMVKHIRQVVNGGRFCKFYRGNKREKTIYGWAGCSKKQGATHFDAYLMWRGNSQPKFYNFTLS